MGANGWSCGVGVGVELLREVAHNYLLFDLVN